MRHHHPRWVRMQVGFRDLTLWSFLMASAHGAGLMVVPVLLGSSTVEAADQMAGHHHMSPRPAPLAALLATAVHTAAYLAVTGLIAWVVYHQVRPRASSQGMAQPQCGLGGCARCHRPGHLGDVTAIRTFRNTPNLRRHSLRRSVSISAARAAG